MIHVHNESWPLKNIDLGQPARVAQADPSRYFFTDTLSRFFKVYLNIFYSLAKQTA